MESKEWLKRTIKGVGIGSLFILMTFFLVFNILFYFGGYFIDSLINWEWLVFLITPEFMVLVGIMTLISFACNGISISLFLLKKNSEL